MARSDIDEDLRARLLTLVLRVSVVLGVVVYVPSVFLSLRQGMYGLVVIDTVALAMVVALLVGERIPFRLRSTLVCLVYYALGVALLMQVGAVSLIYLLGFAVATALLLGIRVGLAATLLSAATMLALGAIGALAPDMVVPGWTRDFTTSIVITINFTLVATLLTLAIGVVLRAFSSALRREIATRAQLQLQIERMPLAHLLTDREFRFTRWNPAAERMFGYTEAEALGRDALELLTPAEDRTAVALTFEELRGGSMAVRGERSNLTKAGHVITCEWHNTPLFDEAGTFVGNLALAQDVTNRKKLQDELRQAHKLEAVGLLAGGIAHDFNNLLSVILSYSELVIAELQADDPLRAEVEEILNAGLRAAGLTRQLLMFSRRQVIEPKVLDLNALLSGIDRMLRPLVGASIELAFVPGDTLGRVCADAGSIEQVIMNLVVNARDAMPTGGTITLETANVGSRVVLSVTDSGTGMDKATVARIFEPFFTTKDKGKGTGLGLSTVFGIVEQCGGTIEVESELELGTTFKIYLPRVDATTEIAAAVIVETSRRGSETILLVEDEDQVREVAHGILRRHGYRLIVARNAGEALLFCEQHVGPIHLLLTDVVMPQMGGPMLAKRLGRVRPAMKVLYMSGYTDDAAFRENVSVAEVAYLPKPLTVDGLTRKVRSVLDDRRDRPSS